jgi:fluoroquinolone transport system permease protein
MSELFKQVKWQFVIFRKNNLVAMIVGVTAFYVLLTHLLRGSASLEKFITLLIYNDPALVGFIFIGISIILEKDQEVLAALFVTPLNRHIYLISRIVTLSICGLISALAMVITAKGFSFNWLHFSVGAFSTCVLFSLVGIFVVSYTREVLHFLLRSVPLLILMSLPLLNYFELTDSSFLKLFPIQGGLSLLVGSYGQTQNLEEMIFGYLSVGVWITLLYWLVYRVFVSRVVKV